MLMFHRLNGYAKRIHGASRRQQLAGLAGVFGFLASPAMSQTFTITEPSGDFVPKAAPFQEDRSGDSLSLGVVQKDGTAIFTATQDSGAPDRGNSRLVVLQVGTDSTNAIAVQNGAFSRATFFQEAPVSNDVFVFQNGDRATTVFLSQTGIAELTAASDGERRNVVRSHLFGPDTTMIAPEVSLKATSRVLDRLDTSFPAYEGGVCMADSPDCPVSVRFTAWGARDEGTAREGVVGYDALYGGGEIGFEITPTPSLVLQTAVGVSQIEVDYSNDLGEVSGLMPYAALRAAYKAGGLRLSAAGALSFAKHSIERPGLGGGAKGDTDSRTVAGTVNATYLFPVTSAFSIGPTAGLDYGFSETDGYVEKGDRFTRQSVGERRVRRLDARIGAEALMEREDLPVQFRLRAFYLKPISSENDRVFSTEFDIFPGQSVLTPTESRDESASGRVDLALRVPISETFHLGLQSDIEFGNEGVHSYGLAAFGRLRF